MLDTPKLNHTFKSGSTLDDAFKFYCFDRELRKLVLGELEKNEVAIRAKMIYELSHRHGAFWYTKSSLFRRFDEYQNTITKIQNEYNRSDEKFISEFKRNYSDPLPPSWMMLELTSFGVLSKLYKNLTDRRARRRIAHYFGLDDKTFES